MEIRYNKCHLYGLKSKKMLKRLLRIPSNNFLNQTFIVNKVIPFLETKTGKPRLIEKPDKQLKKIQKRIKISLKYISVPENVFSGIKGKSYVDNAEYHVGNRYLYKIDIRAFFPSTSREKVYFFFKEQLKTSPDVANVLTSLTTIDLTKTNAKNMPEILDFLLQKGVRTMNHLISGSPASPILSYLANIHIFNELNTLCLENKMQMTVYIDDIVFSSSNNISYNIRSKIQDIVRKHHYAIPCEKVKMHTRHYPKKVTGVIIDKSGNTAIPNRLSHNIIVEFKKLQAKENYQTRRKLAGLLEAARQIKPDAFPAIYYYTKNTLRTYSFYKAKRHESKRMLFH